MFQVGDELPPLKHTATPFQLFRYSAVTWNPHRIHFDEPYAREEGHDGVALHSHLRAALALRCVAEGLGPGWHVTKVAYRLRKPVYAPAELAYTARVTATEDRSPQGPFAYRISVAAACAVGAGRDASVDRGCGVDEHLRAAADPAADVDHRRLRRSDHSAGQRQDHESALAQLDTAHS